MTNDKENKDKDNNKTNSDGVYFSFLVSEEDAKKLNDFGTNSLGLDMVNIGTTYEKRKHSTLFASRQRNNEFNYQDIVEENKDKSVTVKPIGWKLIRSNNTGQTCLALVVHSEELLNSHENIKKRTGLNHAFSDFITHISIHYDFKLNAARLKDMPLPNFDIKLDRLFTKDYHNTDQYKSRIEEALNKVNRTSEVLSNIKELREKLLNNTEVSINKKINNI